MRDGRTDPDLIRVQRLRRFTYRYRRWPVQRVMPAANPAMPCDASEVYNRLILKSPAGGPSSGNLNLTPSTRNAIAPIDSPAMPKSVPSLSTCTLLSMILPRLDAATLPLRNESSPRTPLMRTLAM